MKILFCFLLWIPAVSVHAQTVRAELLNNVWKARWIAVPDESPDGYGVYLFRRTFSLKEKPASFVIHVSADNRYKLFVNGQQVSMGPARGDLQHWNFETLDLSAWLQTGKNIIAAQVWNEGPARAEGQISLRTGFILQGDGDAENILNTNNSWKCIRDNAFTPLPFRTRTYYVAGPGERTDMNLYRHGWNQLALTDSSWKNAQEIMEGIPKSLIGGYGTIPGWLLIPSVIPQMELKMQRLKSIRKSDLTRIPPMFPAEKSPFTIPPNSSATILLDQGFLTNAYPEIIFSGGKSGTISISYAEALYTKYPEKGNRNETDGKTFLGRMDSIVLNGDKRQSFTTLTYRTYRFIQLRIKTQADPIIVEDVYGLATGYPFQMNASLNTGDSTIKQIFDIGWRTARLCAMETYMDCPYYEQLQYIGDARIQALISIYNSGDERLLRNAMNEMDNSRQPEGITLSRHPSFTPQFIPPFSLWYIGMLHDYMMYGKDTAYLKNKLTGERQILQYFRNYQLPDGSLKGLPYWLFSDWVETAGWVSGRAPVGKDGSSSVIDLQLLWAYQVAADMESRFGMKSLADLYTGYAQQLMVTIRAKYWDSTRSLFSDRPEKDLFSQHANILAILTGLTSRQESLQLGKQLLSDSGLAPASVYFKYYLHQALVKAGMGDGYLDWLGIWRENINMGLTTWAEISDINRARSDCHAWGASPNIEFFRTVLGIDSDAPAFSRVRIEPHLGKIKNISGEMPHPKGRISVRYILDNGNWTIEISLPSTITGEFIWSGKKYPLAGGTNRLNINTH